MRCWFAWLVAAAGLSGCGLTANLGEDADDGAPPEANEAGTGDGSSQAADRGDAESVHRIEHTISGIHALAVAGDQLYMATSQGETASDPAGKLYACDMRDCKATSRLLFESPLWSIYWVAVSGDQLSFVEYGNGVAITTCRAPDCEDPTRIDWLRYDANGFWFENGAVVWSQTEDDSIYRCALPDCPGGPQVFVEGVGASSILGSGDVMILKEGGRVWRMIGDVASLEQIRLGPELESLGQASIAEVPISTESASLAVDGDWLYATIPEGCDDPTWYCSVARWPLRGYGKRQVVFRGTEFLQWIQVHDGELVLRPSLRFEVGHDRFGTCRVEDCAGTSREIRGSGWLGPVTADDERVYWVESFTSDDELPPSEVFSIARLPVP